MKRVSLYEKAEKEKNKAETEYSLDYSRGIHVVRGVFRTQSNIYDGAFFAKIVNAQKPLIISAKKLHRRCSTGF